MESKLSAQLRAAGIVLVEKDMRRMSRAELYQHFASERSSRIVLAKLFKSLIWQAHQQIQAGREPKIIGNIRTFWYRFAKVVLSRLSEEEHGKTNPYDVMLKAFTELVMVRRLLRYSDFDFTDENWENRRIGQKHPEIRVFTEKRGWIRFLREVHQTFSVSVLALGGAPSALTSEYTARDILAAMGEDLPVLLVGIVDFDPSGDLIANAFQRQLLACGLQSSEPELLIKPEHYTEAELRLFRFPLPKKQPTKTRNWMRKTGGVLGGAFGLESESMPHEKVMGLLAEWLDPRIKAKDGTHIKSRSTA
jgi:hypothetical protein